MKRSLPARTAIVSSLLAAVLAAGVAATTQISSPHASTPRADIAATTTLAGASIASPLDIEWP